MLSLGIKVSRNIVRKLMKKHRLVKRKMQRKRSIGQSADRDEQFNNIATEKEKLLHHQLIGGNLYRNGRVYCTEAIEVSDYDYTYLADLKIAPHGIYDMKQNKAYINIGTSAETAEFVCDSIKNWWITYGKNDYPDADEILILVLPSI